MHLQRRRLVGHASVALVLLWVGLVLAAAPAASGAPSPCWRAVIDDWARGGIDGEHPLHCYREALHRLPNDIRTYTTAEDDIERALLDAIRRVQSAAQPGGPDAASIAEEARARALQTRASQAVGKAAATALPPAATSPPLRVILGACFALALFILGAIGKYRLRRRAGDPAH
jgi:hypothetical protein